MAGSLFAARQPELLAGARALRGVAGFQATDGREDMGARRRLTLMPIFSGIGR